MVEWFYSTSCDWINKNVHAKKQQNKKRRASERDIRHETGATCVGEMRCRQWVAPAISSCSFLPSSARVISIWHTVSVVMCGVGRLRTVVGCVIKIEIEIYYFFFSGENRILYCENVYRHLDTSTTHPAALPMIAIKIGFLHTRNCIYMRIPLARGPPKWDGYRLFYC